jgi:hypothetical protein
VDVVDDRACDDKVRDRREVRRESLRTVDPGERGVLVTSLDALVCVSWNPFFP